MRSIKSLWVATLLLVAAIVTPPTSGAGDLSIACGEGFAAVELCGLREVLCVPEGCGVVCVSCCPPMCDDDGDCTDQSALECQGASCSCDTSCADECFTVAVQPDGAMAPLLGPAPLAVLVVGLLSGGLWLARRRSGPKY